MTPPRRRPPEPRVWPWYQQVVDAAFATAGLGIAVAMAVRDSYPALGIVLVVACAGKVSASQLVRLLTGRWDERP